MSGKSIWLSLCAIILMGALLFGVAVLFHFSVVLGIIGIIVWMVVPGVFRRKAIDAANGGFDRILAKFIVPLVATFLAFGIIIYLIVTAL